MARVDLGHGGQVGEQSAKVAQRLAVLSKSLGTTIPL